MDSYVIRIYRRDDKNPEKAAGQVELVERGLIKSFTCMDELAEILGMNVKRATGIISKNKAKTDDDVKGGKS